MRDYHIHTTFSDGADSVGVMVDRAVAIGLHEVGISDHVRASTPWLPQYVEAVAAARRSAPIPVWCGVEAKLLDTEGALDLPEDLTGVEYIAIADHQVPTPDGPVHPDEIRRQLAGGLMCGRQVVEMLVEATAAAVASSPVRPLIAHLFSVLPKVGLDERSVSAGLVRHLGAGLAEAGARVELNEKWQCPSRRVASLLAESGVVLVAGSDSHRADDLGRYSHARRAGRGLVAPPSLAW
jgi:putative hydrolase